MHWKSLFLGVFLFAEEMPFKFMAKASRMVKIKKAKISGIKLKSTVPLFLLLLWNTILCFERWRWRRRKQWSWRPPEMGISRTVLGCTIWDFFSIRFEFQVIRKGCITITTNTKPLAIRDFIAGTCWWSQTNSRTELDLERNTCWTPSISPSIGRCAQ